jgi:hypothetical protein
MTLCARLKVKDIGRCAAVHALTAAQLLKA